MGAPPYLPMHGLWPDRTRVLEVISNTPPAGLVGVIMIPWLNTVGGRRQSRRRCAEATVTVALAPQPPGGAHTGRCIVSFSGSVGARPALLTDAGFSADCVIIAAAPARRPRGLDGVSAPARASSSGPQSTGTPLPRRRPRVRPRLAGGAGIACRGRPHRPDADHGRRRPRNRHDG